MAQNVLQNLQELGDEVRGDGGFRSYMYQGNFQTLPFLMWSYATDMDFAAKSSFTQNLTKWAAKSSPRREAASSGARGMTSPLRRDTRSTRSRLEGFSCSRPISTIRSHSGSETAWRMTLGRGGTGRLRGPRSFPLCTTIRVGRPNLRHQAGMSLTARFDKIGMVHSRSSWSTGSDVIHSWFYNGPVAGHFGEGQNHFTIWRGDDPLIMRGGTTCLLRRFTKTSISGRQSRRTRSFFLPLDRALQTTMGVKTRFSQIPRGMRWSIQTENVWAVGRDNIVIRGEIISLQGHQ